MLESTGSWASSGTASGCSGSCRMAASRIRPREEKNPDVLAGNTGSASSCPGSCVPDHHGSAGPRRRAGLVEGALRRDAGDTARAGITPRQQRHRGNVGIGLRGDGFGHLSGIRLVGDDRLRGAASRPRRDVAEARRHGRFGLGLGFGFGFGR